jgi:PhnB protein
MLEFAMTAKVKPIPDGYRSVTPYLIVNAGSTAIDFYKKIFGAKEKMRIPGPDGKVGHAEITIGDSVIMLADECPEMNARGPLTVGGSSVGILLYVTDVDAVVTKAVASGATLKNKVENKFYGDRSGTIQDPFGHIWHVSTHVEDVAEEELERRLKQMSKS